jgi:hypothetical protein
VEGMLRRLRRYASRRAGCVCRHAEGDATHNAQSQKHRENCLRAKQYRVDMKVKNGIVAKHNVSFHLLRSRHATLVSSIVRAKLRRDFSR